ncbi:MAG: hypothetical protein U5K99_03830 [Anaerolineales bacterium]|nr:hypothetical protein [Anaerolineales bacterium]
MISFFLIILDGHHSYRMSRLQDHTIDPLQSAKTLRKEHGRVRAELQSINTYGESTFCGN